MKDVVYYELLKPNQTVTIERYQQQLIDLNHDNARSHVAKVVKDTLSAL